jgi:hypothetical protein
MLLPSFIQKNLIWFLFVLDVTNAFVNPSLSLFGVVSTTTTRVSTPRQCQYQSHLLSTSNQHSSDHFDMEELRQRIQIQQEQNYHPLFDGRDKKEHPQSPSPPPQTVTIILFHPGTEQQGVHTIEYPKGSGTNMILAFESKLACRKFADSLKEQNFFDPTVSEEFELDDLNAMCEMLGILVQVVPEGVEITPPLQNVKHLGHNPQLRNDKNYLDDIFEITDESSDFEVYNNGGSWD